ncbi:C-type lectin domain family 2 member E-like isoform X3 [Ranitomeya variabilis]|uniref:C-type lectin domain family 2 member E-like isoform X3 n=1 Tax=Ranitomeya variabilis TaxID=490064 RepID=UPI004056F76B
MNTKDREEEAALNCRVGLGAGDVPAEIPAVRALGLTQARIFLIVLFLIFALTITFFTLWVTHAVKGKCMHLVTVNYPSNPCEDDWIWSRQKCYYFSSNISEWQTGQDFCASRNASLALLDSIDELNFLLRFKGSSDHWIGLSREQEGRPWEWTNGSLWNNMSRQNQNLSDDRSYDLLLFIGNYILYFVVDSTSDRKSY